MSKHLELLEEENVFRIEELEDGSFKIWEACDHYYSKRFTGSELLELAQEIIELANSAGK